MMEEVDAFEALLKQKKNHKNDRILVPNSELPENCTQNLAKYGRSLSTENMLGKTEKKNKNSLKQEKVLENKA